MQEQRMESRGRARPRSLKAMAGGAAALALAALTAWKAPMGASPQVKLAQAAPAAAVAAKEGYADVVAQVTPSVVTVRIERQARPSPTRMPDDPLLRRFFGDRFGLPEQPAPQRGLGSGVIVSSDGYVLTNHHVVDDAGRIVVELVDRRTFTAKLVGSDPPTDLAVLKIEASNLKALPLGNSDEVRVGDVVLAVGNPLGVGQTVTAGIISAKGRSTGLGDGSYEDFLQTDAPINRGNSGGALVDTTGALVGINSQILSPSGGNIGIGFAIPSNMARAVMTQLIEKGRVERAMLGATVQTVTSDLAESLGLDTVRGAIVSDIRPGSPAERAGLQRGDVVLAIDGKPVDDSNELRNRIASKAPGTEVRLSIRRDGQARDVRVKLIELPSTGQNDTPEQRAERGRYGLGVQPVTPELAARLQLPTGTEGLVVTSVDPSGPAAAAGFREGDVIEQANGQPVRTADELRSALNSRTGRPSLVLLVRDGQTIFLTLRAPESRT